MEGNHATESLQIIRNWTFPAAYLSNQKLQSMKSNESHFDSFATMKENALFLLELSSTNSRKY